MLSRYAQASLNGLALTASALAIFTAIVLGSAVSRADSTPSLKFEWIDEEGQIVALDWRSSASWTWAENRLTLQTWFEAPKHLTANLPPDLRTKIQNANARGPFQPTADHVLFLLPLDQPVVLLPADSTRNRFLRITVDFQKTNWMRHSGCKRANPYLEERGFKDGGPLFVSLHCTSADGGTWVEVASSTEVKPRVETPKGIRVKKTESEASLWIADIADDAKPVERKLANLSFVDGDGVILASYSLAANPAPPDETLKKENSLAASADVQSNRKLQASMGLHLQFVSSDRTDDRTVAEGRSKPEFAISLRAKRPLAEGTESDAQLVFDSELAVRRLGAGLDGDDAGNHLSWIYFGLKPKGISQAIVSASYGLQIAVLDSRFSTRDSEVSVSPALELEKSTAWGQASLSLAPLDLRSNLAVARARLEVPVSAHAPRYAFVVEGFGARTLLHGSNGLNMSGFSLGIKGAF